MMKRSRRETNEPATTAAPTPTPTKRGEGVEVVLRADGMTSIREAGIELVDHPLPCWLRLVVDELGKDFDIEKVIWILPSKRNVRLRIDAEVGLVMEYVG